MDEQKPWLVISDIHGALHGAEIMTDAFYRHDVCGILCLGDVLYHGPRNDLPDTYAPKKVISIMNRMADQIIAVRGNCEAEVDQMVLDFPCMATNNTLLYQGRKIFMSHGHVYSPDHLPGMSDRDVFLSGHTHIPTAEKKSGVFLCNPGSPSIPKEGHPKTYGLLAADGFFVLTEEHEIYMKVEF